MNNAEQPDSQNLDVARLQACTQAMRGLAQIGFGAFACLGRTMLGACLGSERLVAGGVTHGAISIHNGITHVKQGITRLAALEEATTDPAI
jgi:hypothetical protein